MFWKSFPNTGNIFDFGLVVFVAVNLAVGIYNIWDSTPVIIGSKCLSLDFSFITFKTWNLFNS